MSEGLVVGLVLVAAALHATWNAIAKSSGDPLVAMGIVTVSNGLLAGGLALWLPFPEPGAWPWLAASVVFHFLYQLALVRAYQYGDLSQVYPIARGLAPCVVAGGAAWLAGEALVTHQVAGLALASLCIGSLAWIGRAHAPLSGRALVAALATACMIGAYTVVDGKGVRLAGGPLRYVAWMMFLDSFPIALFVLARRGRALARVTRREVLWGAGGGAMALVAYGIVLVALSLSTMAGVAALRETSVLFATWIGTRMFGEPFGRGRLLAAAGVAAGLLLLRW